MVDPTKVYSGALNLENRDWRGLSDAGDVTDVIHLAGWVDCPEGWDIPEMKNLNPTSFT
jgi:hypothetical protein